MVGKLHDDWFIETFGYYKYFDKSQRNKYGNTVAPSDRTRANTANIKEWKKLALHIFDNSFKENRKYHYEMEIKRITVEDGYVFRRKLGTKKTDTPN